jgi:hypothetical protein
MIPAGFDDDANISILDVKTSPGCGPKENFDTAMRAVDILARVGEEKEEETREEGLKRTIF